MVRILYFVLYDLDLEGDLRISNSGIDQGETLKIGKFKELVDMLVYNDLLSKASMHTIRERYSTYEIATKQKMIFFLFNSSSLFQILKDHKVTFFCFFFFFQISINKKFKMTNLLMEKGGTKMCEPDLMRSLHWLWLPHLLCHSKLVVRSSQACNPKKFFLQNKNDKACL